MAGHHEKRIFPMPSRRLQKGVRGVITLGAVLASLLLIAAPRARALDPNRRISQYGHTAWRVQDGFSAGFSITQTTDGYIWVATSVGLMRFDGVRFVPWVAPKDAPPTIRKVTFLLGARDGSLWIGTTSSLNRLKDGQLQSYTKPTDRSGISVIFEDHAGTIWVTRYRVPKGEGPLCKVAGNELQCFGKADGISVTYGLGLTQDTLGNLWFGSSVLCRWRPGSSSTYFDNVLKNKKVGYGVADVAPGESGSVWASIDGVGPQLGVRYYSEGNWASYVVPGFDGATVRSHALFVDRNKSLWVGTENNGLYRVSGGIADHYGSADGLSGNSVGLVYEDHEGNLWVLTESGIDMFRDTPVMSFSMQQGLSASQIRSILALRNGSVWIGNAGAVDILRGGRNSSLSARQGLPGQDVAALFEDHSGGVWLGVDNKLLTYESGRFREVRRSDGSALAGQKEVTAITEDVDHNIWALTGEHHVFRIANHKVEEDIPLPDNLLPSNSLAADREAGFWISTKTGTVAHYRDGHVVQTISLEDSSDPFLTLGLIIDSDNSLLVPSVRGLFRWKDGRWSVLDARNGLPCSSISAAVEDNYGSLWVYAQCGLLRVDAKELAKWRNQPDSRLAFQLFDPIDGAHPGYQDPLQPQSSKAPDGRLWFTNGEIAQVINPNRLYRNGIPPPVHIEEVIVDHKTYSAQSGLRLPALTRDLEIDYTALSFVVPQKVQFRYKLEGYDREWQDPGSRRQAFYSNLPPRNYTFRVKARNNSGLWNEAGASLDFLVAPAYYQTTWFRLSCVAAFIALLWALHRWRVHQLKGEEKRLREAVETIPAMTFTTLSDGSNTFVNKRWTEYTGLSGEKTSGTGWQRAIHPEDLVRHSENWRISVATGQPFEDEARFRRAADGEYRWFLVRGVPLRNRHGKIVRWYGTLTDIEDRKRAEEALGGLSRDLQESKAKLEEAQRITHVGYWEWDILAGRVNLSDEAYRIYGLQPQTDPIALATVRELIYPEDREAVFRTAEDAILRGVRYDSEHRLVRPSGEMRTVHSLGDLKRDASGRPYRMFGTVQDITDRKRAEEALELMSRDVQESKARLEEAQSIAHVGHWVWDLGNDGLTWSDETYRIFGLRPQERPMNVAAFQEMVHPDDREFLLRATQDARGGGRPDVEYRIIRPSGEVRIVHGQGAVMRNVSGQPRQMFGTIQDITDRKRAEEELWRSQFYHSEGQRLAHIGSWAFNPSGFFEHWSQELFKIYGLDPQKGAPTLEQYLATVHPQDRDFMANTIKKMHAERSGCDVKKRIVRPDGELRYIRCVGIPVLEGEVLKGFLGTAIDITEQELLTRELERRQAYLAEAQRLTHTGSWTIDVATDEHFWSEEIFRIYEFDPEKVTPASAWSLVLDRVHPDDRASLQQRKKMEFTQTEWADSEGDYRIVLPDGKIKHLHTIAHPVMDASGQIIEIIGTTMDVTERKQVEDSLRRSENHLGEAQRLTHTGSWAWRSADRKAVHISEEFYRIYGFDPAEGVPTWEEYFERIHPEDRLKWTDTVQRAIVEKADYDQEFRILLPNGKVKWIRTVGHPVLSDAGDLEQFVGSSTDITERKSAEHALQRSEAYLAEAQRLSHTGSWVWNPASDNTYYSEECFRLLGFEPHGPAPPLASVIQRIHPDDQAGCKELVEKGVLNKRDFELDYRIVHPDKGLRDIHCLCHPVLDRSGDLIELVGTVIDITERKRAEQEREKLRRLEAELAHINRVSTLGEMAASLAHEIKQPIAAAITTANSCIEWLAHEPPNLDRARAAAARIDKYGNRAAEIIDRIRSLYRKSPPQREPVDVNGIIQEMLTLLKGEATRHAVAMRTELSAEVPKIMVDRVQLQQVFMNLMLNAMEAMKDSGGELTVKSELQDGQLQFSISDTGVGLPAEKMDQIFSAFFTTKPQGSGMGLAISRSIVESHGGRLWATTNVGQGATFHFTLPTHVTESSSLVA